MNLEQPQDNRIASPPIMTTGIRRLAMVARRTTAYALFALLMVMALLLPAASMPAHMQQRNALVLAPVAAHGFNLIDWEIDALSAKLAAALNRPAAGLSVNEGVDLVWAYMDRAHRIDEIEDEITQHLSERESASSAEISALQDEIEALRAEQEAVRAQVEQVIEWQVRDELARAGLTLGGAPFPPVQFTFVEPPKKMVVSPRDRIQQVYYRMLEPTISQETIETAERQIFETTDLSAYITNIGGLGAYPAMVVDRASLGWVLSTVAHEWVHNYLTLAPLGIRYGQSNDLTTMNETVADIVGDEIGLRLVQRFYPELLPVHHVPTAAEVLERESAPRSYFQIPFDFRREMHTTRLEVDRLLAEGKVEEMHTTRLEVDRLLAEGKVEEAEAYMETRRQFFVENGRPLRVLNQAYFAFHGAYGTSAASTDPIGPKLVALRDVTEGVADFLRLVRNFTSVEELEAALAARGFEPNSLPSP
jgi:hypothetical protein